MVFKLPRLKRGEQEKLGIIFWFYEGYVNLEMVNPKLDFIPEMMLPITINVCLLVVGQNI